MPRPAVEIVTWTGPTVVCPQRCSHDAEIDDDLLAAPDRQDASLDAFAQREPGPDVDVDDDRVEVTGRPRA